MKQTVTDWNGWGFYERPVRDGEEIICMKETVVTPQALSQVARMNVEHARAPHWREDPSYNWKRRRP